MYIGVTQLYRNMAIFKILLIVIIVSEGECGINLLNNIEIETSSM